MYAPTLPPHRRSRRVIETPAELDRLAAEYTEHHVDLCLVTFAEYAESDATRRQALRTRGLSCYLAAQRAGVDATLDRIGRAASAGAGAYTAAAVPSSRTQA